MPSWHGTYQCTGVASRHAIVNYNNPNYNYNFNNKSDAGVSGVSGAAVAVAVANEPGYLWNVFIAALTELNVLYDEHRDYTALLSTAEGKLEMLMVVMSRATDDSGWTETTMLDTAENVLLLMCGIVQRVMDLGLLRTALSADPALQPRLDALTAAAAAAAPASSASAATPADDSCLRKLYHLGLHNVRLVNLELQLQM